MDGCELHDLEHAAPGGNRYLNLIADLLAEQTTANFERVFGVKLPQS